jgi:hypothetical protein
MIRKQEAKLEKMVKLYLWFKKYMVNVKMFVVILILQE